MSPGESVLQFMLISCVISPCWTSPFISGLLRRINDNKSGSYLYFWRVDVSSSSKTVIAGFSGEIRNRLLRTYLYFVVVQVCRARSVVT